MNVCPSRAAASSPWLLALRLAGAGLITLSVYACASSDDTVAGSSFGTDGGSVGAEMGGATSTGGSSASAGGSPDGGSGMTVGGAGGTTMGGGRGGTDDGGASSAGAPGGGAGGATSTGGMGGAPAPTYDDFGNSCDEDDDCQSGKCIEDEVGDKVCTRPCIDGCPDDRWRCGLSTDPTDPAGVCWPRYANLCKPCKTDVECKVAGTGDPAECVEYVQGTTLKGSFCANVCQENSDCESGYGCLTVPGKTAKFCVKKTLECACQERWVGAATVCARGSGGSSQCTSERTCESGGVVSMCEAAAPTGETCNGEDDDCNGIADDTGDALCPSDDLACTDNVCGGNAGCQYPIKDGTCLIGGECFADDDANPTNPCLICDSSQNKTGWSFAPTTKSCNDADSCTASDTCDGAGSCAGSGVSPGQDSYDGAARNDTSGTATNLNVTHQDWETSTTAVSGNFHTTSDVDWYRYELDDVNNISTCYVSTKQPIAYAEIKDGIATELCVSVSCNENAAEVTCNDGSKNGDACCGDVVRIDYNCPGTSSEDATVRVEVKGPGNACGTYEVDMGNSDSGCGW